MSDYWTPKQCSSIYSNGHTLCILSQNHPGKHLGHDSNDHGHLVTWNKIKGTEK